MTSACKPFIDAVRIVTLALACLASGEALAWESPRYSAAYERAMASSRATPHALGQLGFRYENGFGVPQNYIAAVDLYRRAAEQGDAFAQSRLGLSYDKGHGVPQDFVLSYKWLDLAAARASWRERDFYLRLRNAVASKMSYEQVAEGQRLALRWTQFLDADRW
jgi:uncharacterized protein